jgi:hypothetical protein
MEAIPNTQKYAKKSLFAGKNRIGFEAKNGLHRRTAM